MQCGCVVIYFLIDGLICFQLKTVKAIEQQMSPNIQKCLSCRNFWSSINKSLVFQFGFMCAVVLHNQPIWEAVLVLLLTGCLRPRYCQTTLAGPNEDVVQRHWHVLVKKHANMETFALTYLSWHIKYIKCQRKLSLKK